MTTKLEIFKLALSQAGLGTTNDTNSSDPKVVTLANAYEIFRRYLLEDHYWNFSITRATLALTTETPNNGEWKYIHSLPVDFLSLKDVHSNSSYEIENNQIYTDSTTVKIEYVKDVTDASKFSPGFAIVLAYSLAILLAGRYPMISGVKMQELIREKEKLYKRAKINDGKQSAPVKRKLTDEMKSLYSNPYGIE